jgi:hypothetical protein
MLRTDMAEAMVVLISRLVPREAQPGAVVLALTGLPVPWPEILSRPDEGIVDLLAGFHGQG